ncbi:MAG TPA: heavy-metal-associated domain-containing protein [Erysipelothrix sp.]|nr:heavy-metal-associated domain-containing protein [Erysipelothrix sp.]
MKQTIHVSNMSCKHCEARISKALEEKSINAEIDLTTKSVVVNDVDVVVAKEAIVSAGYQPE